MDSNFKDPRQKERWYLLRLENKLSSELSLSLFGGLSDRVKTICDIKEEVKRAFYLYIKAP